MMTKKLINLATLLLVFICTSAHASNDLLNNFGAFESAGFWKSNADFSIDKSTFKQGNASAKIVAADINDKQYLYCYVPMKAGKSYQISLWYKTQNIIPDSDLIKISLNYNRKGGGNGSAGAKDILFPAGDNNTDWKEFSAVVMPPPETDLCQFILSFSGIKGTIWLDGLTITPLEQEKAQVSSIRETDTPPVIDGLDNDKCWQDATPMTSFLHSDYDGKTATAQTEVKLSYDAQNFYLFYKCMEPRPGLLTANVKERDGAVWNDDSVELFLSPMYGKTFHFVTNSIGTLYDAEIDLNDQTMQGFVRDATYNSRATVKSFIGNNYWSAEISIPIKSVTSLPLADSSWKINFVRSNQVSDEESSYSRLIGAFYQPKDFSTIAFTQDAASVTRAVAIAFVNPLAIKRINAMYSQLLSDKPGNYITFMWNHNMEQKYLPKDIAEQLTDEKWKQEVNAQFEELGEAGMSGPSLPWADSGGLWWQTVENCMSYFKKYGMIRKCNIESSYPVRLAVENGAEVLNKDAVDGKKAQPLISLIDPIYVDIVKKEIVKLAQRYKDKPYIGTMEGRDEPNINPIMGKISEMGPKMKEWNNEVITQYGFGKYAMPAPNDPSYWEHPKTHPFQRIAFNNWMSDKYLESKKQMYETLKRVAPKLQYKGVQFWFMSGFIPYDYSLFGKYTDVLSCDPYASSAERREGRGIYNHGFGTKLLKDLGGKPTTTVVQAFDYAGYSPKPNDLREWVSQALKTGASGIEFYESAEKYGNPALYEEMLRISKIVTSMKKVELPANADTAIICSLDSEAAEEANGDQIYTAYSILGEKVGSWFDFVSDKQIKRNEKDLSKYKIIYLPLAKYMEKSVVEKLTDYVRNGGTLVIGDPEAFSFDEDGKSLSTYREKLCGAKLENETFKADSIKITSLPPLNQESYPLLKENSIYDKIHLAHGLTFTSNDHKVIAQFSNGQPAFIENNFGQGKVFYFAANPFAPDVVLINSKISGLFEMIQKDAGAKTGLPIWNFLLPATGGEVEVKHILRH